MTEHTHDSDDDLLRLLRAALEEADPVPPEVLAMAKAAPDLAGLDAELAELVHDSDEALVGVRGSGSARQLDFASEAVDLVVVLSGAELTGQLVPASAVAVELVRAGTVVRTATCDDLGRFRIEDLPAGPLRLRVPAVRLLTPEFEA